MEEGKKLHCCNCGELIDAQVKFCPNCGFNFEEDDDKPINNHVNQNSTSTIETHLNAIQVLSILYCIISTFSTLRVYFALKEMGIDCISIVITIIASTLTSSITLYGFGTMLNNTESIKKQLEKSNTLLEKLASNEQTNK